VRVRERVSASVLRVYVCVRVVSHGWCGVVCVCCCVRLCVFACYVFCVLRVPCVWQERRQSCMCVMGLLRGAVLRCASLVLSALALIQATRAHTKMTAPKTHNRGRGSRERGGEGRAQEREGKEKSEQEREQRERRQGEGEEGGRGESQHGSTTAHRSKERGTRPLAEKKCVCVFFATSPCTAAVLCWAFLVRSPDGHCLAALAAAALAPVTVEEMHRSCSRAKTSSSLPTTPPCTEQWTRFSPSWFSWEWPRAKRRRPRMTGTRGRCCHATHTHTRHYARHNTTHTSGPQTPQTPTHSMKFNVPAV
jgi:hypothetical protein